MGVARSVHTATLLLDGKVLIAGGSALAPVDFRTRTTDTAELYDPVSGTFSPTGRMTLPRQWHTATLLQDGRVLIVGGEEVLQGEATTTTAELYDPSTGSFSRTGNTVAGQRGATATLLKSGKVLIAGGAAWTYCCVGPGAVSTPELYDPSTGTFALTGEFADKTSEDYNVTGGPSVSGAARLPDGRVLIAAEPKSEIYDPETGKFSVVGSMATTHPLCRPPYISGRTLTVLGSGQVLLAGGAHEDCGRYAEVERFDPRSGTFAIVGHLTHWRNWHTATLLPDGLVLMAGGEFAGGTIDMFDPETGTAVASGTLGAGRSLHTATLLRDGRVLIAGGEVFLTVFLGSLASAELYTPRRLDAPVSVFPENGIVTEDLHPRLQVHNVPASRRGAIVTYAFEWSTRSDFRSGSDTAFQDAVPAGEGGDTAFSVPNALAPGTTYYWRARAMAALAEGDIRITVGGDYSDVRTFRTPGGVESRTISAPQSRLGQTVASTRGRAAAEPPGTLSATGSMTTARGFHTATLLRNGKVLIAGGTVSTGGASGGAITATAELYDPSTGTFSRTGSMTVARSRHTATLLANGRVLIVGGEARSNDDPRPTGAELYDPIAGTFTATGSLVGVQVGATATRLNTGKVLIAGGIMPTNASLAPVSNPELYDPSTGQFTPTGPFVYKGGGAYLTGGPSVSAATLMGDGRVLISATPRSEIYDPVTGRFSETGFMTTPCVLGGRPQYIGGRTATLLMTGEVLLAGGAHEDCGRFRNLERYDPASGVFNQAGVMSMPRDNHTATLLADGNVLLAGGESDRGGRFSGTDDSAELYDPGTRRVVPAGSMSARRAGHTAMLLADGRVLLAGGYVYAGIGLYQGTVDSADVYTPAAIVAPVPRFPPVTQGIPGGEPPAAAPTPSLTDGVPRMDGAAATAASTRDRMTTPSDLVGAASGSGVVLMWRAPAGARPVRYAISGGTDAEASTLPVLVTPDASTSYVVPALASGTYQFKVYAVFPDGLSLPSDVASVVATGATAGAEPASGTIATVDRTGVTVLWTPGPSGTLYDVEIGREPARADVAVLATTEPGVTFRADDHATYYLRVKAVRGALVSAPSNEVSVTVGETTCGEAPGTAVLLPASTTGGATTFSWLPAAGALAERYRVEVTGAGDRISLMSSGRGSSLVARLEPGLYTARVSSINACGASAASNAITLGQPDLPAVPRTVPRHNLGPR